MFELILGPFYMYRANAARQKNLNRSEFRHQAVLFSYDNAA
jgi:hypothetical protein